MPWLGANGLLPGRGVVSRAAGGRPMPWLGANGLLPGRGPLGRAAGRAVRPAPPSRPPAAGVLGRGPGVGPGLAGAGVVGPAAAAGACGAGVPTAGGRTAGVGGAAGAAGAVVAAGTGAAGAGAAGATGGADTGAGDDPADTADAGGVAGAAGGGGVVTGVAEALRDATTGACAGAGAAHVSLILRTTGGSMVEDADRTNSPCSFRWASNALLSTPSSLASSYTRTLATLLLLLVRALRRSSAGHGPLSGVCSSLSSHRVLISV